jgi:NADPH-dependent 2,4-dienoyl-CoA reductase/sulfur reductase-like enzyme
MPDILVVGAGPAGIAAACTAAACGAAVTVIDDNATPGGQIWRGASTNPWLRRFHAARLQVHYQTRVLSPTLAGGPDGPIALRYDKLILATGARERFLPFPGWTLPGVTGAGGLQALVKAGLPIEGKRVIVAGTGPLLLAVAAYLKQRGARVLRIAEQTGPARIRRFALSLLASPAKLTQALRLKAQLLGVPYTTACWPISAEGGTKLEAVRLRQPSKTWTERCDYLACGFGLVPNTELAQLLGCELRNGFVAVDEHQQTSIPAIYCAGEPTGIAGLDAALREGRTAALAACGQPHRPRTPGSFQSLLQRTFALRNELRTLPAADTIVCRCEDVPLGRIQQHSGWRDAKLQTRCGMGPCQGRICGPALEFLTGWPAESVRPPLFPTKVSYLASG